MGKAKVDVSKGELKRLYNKEELSISEIAKRFYVSRETISNRLKEYNIKIRKKQYFIKLPKRELCNSYEKKKLITVQIAKIYGCCIATINKRLREYGVKIRTNPQYISISRKVLERLYLKEKLSTVQIAKKVGCGKTTVSEKMKKFGIKARSRTETSKMIKHPVKYKISKKRLIDLYYNKKLSPYQIAKIYNCSPSAIFHKMYKVYKIPLRDLFEAINLTIERRSRSIAKSVSKYPKFDFNGFLNEKAYLIGFRLGDLYVRKQKFGQTIVVQCCSSKREQIELIQHLFNKYGHIRIRKDRGDGDHAISCYLNTSFDFLLKDKDEIDNWVLNNKDCFINFLAGYIDAEGSFGVYKGHAQFFIGSYQKNIINSIYEKLKEINIALPQPRVEVNGGYVDKRGVKTHKDLWGLNIRREIQLLKFVRIIKPFLRHAKRLKDAEKVENHLKNKLEYQKLNWS